jgi:hypothetical protein
MGELLSSPMSAFYFVSIWDTLFKATSGLSLLLKAETFGWVWKLVTVIRLGVIVV